MLNHIKRYPLSLLVIFTVIYLSFFRPPEIDDELPLFPGIDKMVGATLCPILLSGVIELLQAYATTHRGGEWWDFAANTAGVLLATLFFTTLYKK